MDRPGAVQTQLRFGHHSPGREHADWAALSVAAHVLGGGLSCPRLNTVLREEKGYTYGMHAGLARLRGSGLFVAEGAVHTEVTAPAVTERAGRLPEPDRADHRGRGCERSVRSLADSAPAQYETARAVAAEFADAAAHGLPAGFPARNLAAVQATPPESGGRDLRRHIDPGRLALVEVGDAAQIRKPLEEDLGYGPVSVVR